MWGLLLVVVLIIGYFVSDPMKRVSAILYTIITSGLAIVVYVFPRVMISLTQSQNRGTNFSGSGADNIAAVHTGTNVLLGTMLLIGVMICAYRWYVARKGQKRVVVQQGGPLNPYV